MKFLRTILFVLCISFFVNNASAAHYIVGQVNNSINGADANGKSVILWNPVNGINDNITDIIGTSGNSGADNIYLVDCESLTNPCNFNDTISIKVLDSGDGYVTKIINVSVTGAGFDLAENLVLNSPPMAINLIIDDDIGSPIGEIDLSVGGDRRVNCYGIITDSENDSINNVYSEFFDNSLSYYGDSNDNNNHYTNESCFLNSSYAANQTFVNCSFNLAYYANSNNWNCSIRIFDSIGANKIYSNVTFINKLLAISISDFLDFGTFNVSNVSQEKILNVTNFGNSKINISIEGYGVTRGDGLAMNCSNLGVVKNISVGYQKYNLTDSNPGELSLMQFESLYQNLTNNSVIKKFDLNYRQNDLINEATNSTYWRIYIPEGVVGNCSGNILFGATQGAES